MTERANLESIEAGSAMSGDSPKGAAERKTRGKEHSDPFSAENTPKLIFCFVGLQVSYIAWGVVQEQLMTQEYGGGRKFTSASFCVFGNRFFALFIALGIVLFQKHCKATGASAAVEEKEKTHDKSPTELTAPFYAYAACSASNSLSSFAQYEALKFVSFPMQVLSKSCKIIPVMIVGILLNKKVYPRAEYIDALVITASVAMFTLSEKQGKANMGQHDDSLWGLVLLTVYLTCDSFTSQWQDRVYKAYSVNQYQMMLGVNIWSMFFTGVSLIRSGEGVESFIFIMGDAKALTHMIILSITSATGQLFIYYTVKEFGPVTFTIIMTTRQIFSLFFSCLLFAHPMKAMGWIGAVVVFLVLFNRIKRGKGAQFWALGPKRGSKQ
jgi:adenosine 3'-phospho 5'-phosphosulfate transporter B2